MLAEHGDRAHWVQNLRHDPRVVFSVGERRYSGLARVFDEASESARGAAVRAWSVEKYGWGGGTIVEISGEEAAP